MAYTIEGLERSGERSFIGIEPSPDRALDLALDAESRGLARVTIISGNGWKYSVAELASVTRRQPHYRTGSAAEVEAAL